MKKSISVMIALCLILINASAAPYKTEYFNTTQFHISTLINAAKKHNVNIEYNKPSSTAPSINTVAGGSTIGISPDLSVDTSIDPAVSNTPKTMSQVVASLCVITGVSKTLYNQEVVTQLTYRVNNSPVEYTCYINDDSRVYAGKYTVDDINPGSLCYIGLGNGAVVKRYSVIAIIQSGLPVVDVSAMNGTYNSSKINVVYSYIKEYYNGRNDNIAIETDGDSYLVVTENSKQYTVDFNRKNVKVLSGDCLNSEIYKATYDSETDKTTAYPIFAIEYDGEAVFVCSYTTQIIIDGDVTQK